MKRKWITILYWAILPVFVFFSITQQASALDEHEKLWLGINANRPLSEDKMWLYTLFTQIRLIDKPHPWQNNLIEGGIGYQLSSNESIWVGYRWSGINPNNQFFEVHTLWQRLLATLLDDSQNRIISRSQLEESRRSNQAELSYRFRERLSFELIRQFFGNINPLFYDEAFFQLNKTNYLTHQFISENRLFLGFNLYTSKDTFWQIGYINQYEFAPPNAKVNQMNHILAISYNMI